MFRGYYTAGSGLIMQQKRLDAYAHNVANVNTAGYKKDALITGTFGEHLAIRMNTYKPSSRYEIGQGVFMTTIDQEYVDHEQGTFETTQRPMDIAIAGPGFFVVNDGEGNPQLTRAGEFSLDEEGYLILPGYGRVQGEGGDIQVGTSELVVDKNGNIFLPPEEEGEEYQQLDRLLVVIAADQDTMKKAANGTFISEDYAPIEENDATWLLQYTREKSNVQMAEEMTRIISSQRSFQSASQLVRMYDEMSQKSNEQIGRVR